MNDTPTNVTPLRPKHAPLIKLAADFHERPAADQIKYLHELASSMNHALDIMQQERNEGLEKIIKLRAQLQSAEQQISQQKAINMQMITQANSQQEAYGQQINQLTQRNATLERMLDELAKKHGNG